MRMLSSTSMTYHSVFVYYDTHILYISTFKVKLLIFVINILGNLA